ncbi:DUF4492 domain-containing protein [Campylobacter sp. RM13119]|uniref:DUF4492 domain-containing protein n=1 Tax=Campylobacter californiensis TaxID=1032243 RepID=UPI001475FC94|nr:DUF4492 domain-containing protein [Campylobacter sp. RM13119]MBE3606791.1 DUF4492 domain-containing protein [Campylobacter sp. RM13119]
MRDNIFTKIFRLYVDGFRSMKVGKKLWAIIIIKLVIMFAVLKVFFFNETLNTKFQTPEQKSEFVLDNMTNKEP